MNSFLSKSHSSPAMSCKDKHIEIYSLRWKKSGNKMNPNCRESNVKPLCLFRERLWRKGIRGVSPLVSLKFFVQTDTVYTTSIPKKININRVTVYWIHLWKNTICLLYTIWYRSVIYQERLNIDFYSLIQMLHIRRLKIIQIQETMNWLLFIDSWQKSCPQASESVYQNKWFSH